MRLCVTGTMSSALPWTSSWATPSGARAAGEAAAKRSERRLAQEARHRAAAEPFLVRALEVEDAGLGDRRDRAHARAAAGHPRCEAMAGSEPDGEVTAGRVTARDHSTRVHLVDLGQPVECGGDVVERAGPPTPRLPDTPVLDVPGGDPTPGEVARERCHQRAVPPVRQKPPWRSATTGQGPPSCAGR